MNDFVTIKENEHQRTLQRGDSLFTGSSETAEEVGMSSVITTDLKEAIYLNSFCIGYRLDNNNLLDPEFSKHLFRSRQIREQLVRTANGVTRFNISKNRLAQVKVPIPELKEQQRIAAILDKFEALTHSITNGLPREIELRQKQYAYYRDLLFSFSSEPANA